MKDKDRPYQVGDGSEYMPSPQELPRQQNNYDLEDLKPCPFCGQPVEATNESSPDGTVKWVRIMHGPTIDCGVSLIDTDTEAAKKWNTRQ